MARDQGETIRAFVALDLDAASVRRIGRLSDRLRMGSGAPSASWTPVANFHVTLKFLGDVHTDAAVSLGTVLAPLAAATRAPAPSAVRLDAFPSAQEARVVVVELLDETKDVANLAAKVEELASKLDVPKEDRPYRPHVTLAHTKRPYDARRWLRPELAEGTEACQTTHLTLYRSRSQAGGTVYVPIARFALG